MKSIKISDATGATLDWLVGIACGYEMRPYGVESLRARIPGQGVIAPWRPTRDWHQAGPIIERENITVIAPYVSECPNGQKVTASEWRARIETESKFEAVSQWGTSPLIAAMRCYVASKLGDTADVPEELT